ncbi:DUF4190 domain-containing protein [Curtobacterium sp. 1310]|uniref:DUF4190 domain-containing protein n=1 Tax=Curtobacterium sp. 1310 TaxID=2806570 RepID=UPI001AE3837E
MTEPGTDSVPPQVNLVAITALIFTFVVAPAGLVLGLVARSQIRRSSERGAGIATAAIVIGGIVTALYVLPFLLVAPDIVQHMF